MNLMESPCPTVLVMHPDPLLSAGLVTALRQHTSYRILLDGVDPEPADGRAIDVVVADFESAMRLVDPGARAARRRLAAARLLVLTHDDRETDIRRAVEAGIHGYLLVGGALGELIEALTAVVDGLRYLGRGVAQRMADSLARAVLTSRETEVLRLVVTGEPNKSIARRLDIEVGTVKSHMSAIMAKLGATSRTQAAGIATMRGLVEHGAAVDSPHTWA